MRAAVLLAVVLILGAPVMAAELPAQWVAEESWPGGQQADARLDRPVTFWGAGIPLATVFAGIAQQTGVEFGFFPAEDQNARVCLNLYLNPDHPPALRDLMAQLSWVTGCAFSVSAEEPRRYWLLSTTVGEDVLGRLRQEERQRTREVEARNREVRQNALATLEQWTATLQLSPTEAVARYRGQQDMQLLALLSPTRRRTLELAALLTPEQREGLAAQGRLEMAFSELSAEQQAKARQALEVSDPAAPTWALQFRLYGRNLYVMAERDPNSDDPEKRHLARLRVVTLTPDGALGPPQENELRAQLGEPLLPVPTSEEVAQRQQEEQRQEEEQDRARQEQERTAWRQSMLRVRSLSPAAETELASFVMAWNGRDTYALWQLQEATARATGKHVISDCFFQPAWDLDGLEAVSEEYHRLVQAQREHSRVQAEEAAAREEQGLPPAPDEAPKEAPASFDFTLRDWLTAVAHPQPELSLEHALAEGIEEHALGWEWGDAGSFLRFRSVHPEVWRGAMLPAASLAALEAILAPHVEELATAKLPTKLTCAVRNSQLAAMLSPLNMTQFRLGSRLVRSDPAAPLGIAQRVLGEQQGESLDEDGAFACFLAGLGPEQWRRLLGDGVPLAELLTWPITLALLDRMVGIEEGVPQEVMEEAAGQRVTLVLSASAGDPPTLDDVVATETWQGAQREDRTELQRPVELELTAPTPLPAVRRAD